MDNNLQSLLSQDQSLAELLETANIPSTTALAVLEGGKEAGLEAGANVVMLVFTPLNVKEKYDLYKGKHYV